MADRSRADMQQIQALPPLTFTMFGADGRVLRRVTAVKPPFAFDVPKELRKRIARTEVLDSRGVVVSTWEASWAVDA